MNRSHILYILITLLLPLLVGCSAGKDKPDAQEIKQEELRKGHQKNIIIYGSMNCIHCHQFMRKLDSDGIEYEFRDVDASDDFFHELQEKLQAIGYTGAVQYPVLDIEGDILINPTFKEAEKKMYNKPGPLSN